VGGNFEWWILAYGGATAVSCFFLGWWWRGKRDRAAADRLWAGMRRIGKVG
jgi:hypothetical protein